MLEDNPNSNSSKKSEQDRLDIIKQLDPSKAFSVHQQMNMTNNLSREQAIDLLKDMFVHIAYKDQTYFKLLMKEGF